MYEEKAAQAAALFLLKAGGSMPHLKLMKLLYIADRESYRRCGSPITGDEMVSMPNGPVLSQTYELMKEDTSWRTDYWSSYVGPLRNKTVALVDGITEETGLGALSRGDRDVVEHVWKQCGRMSPNEIVKHTHKFPEWENPRGSSRPIERFTLFKALGMTDEQAQSLVEECEDQDALDAYWAEVEARVKHAG